VDAAEAATEDHYLRTFGLGKIGQGVHLYVHDARRGRLVAAECDFPGLKGETWPPGLSGVVWDNRHGSLTWFASSGLNGVLGGWQAIGGRDLHQELG